MRLAPLLWILLVALAVAPAASADKPHRDVGPQPDFSIPGQCAAPILGHVDGNEINTLFFDRDGTTAVKQIVVFPGNTLTLTNAETRKSITISGAGSFQQRADSDGSLRVDITGHGFFAPNPLTGEPGIWYLSGHARATFDAEGNMISGEISGQIADLCPELSS